MMSSDATVRQFPPDCLLCQIANGELRVDKLIETDHIVAVMNTREPLSRGHCVFFPKRHASTLHEADDRDLSEILLVMKKVARAIGAEHYNVLQNNGALAHQTVFHVHFHLIPKWSEAEGLRFGRDLPKGIDQTEITRKIKERLLPATPAKGA